MAQLNIYFVRGDHRAIYTQVCNANEIPDMSRVKSDGRREYSPDDGWQYEGYDYLPNSESAERGGSLIRVDG